jgi:hypothetical protein
MMWVVHRARRADADVKQSEERPGRVRMVGHAGDGSALDPPDVEARLRRQAAGVLGLDCGRERQRLGEQQRGGHLRLGRRVRPRAGIQSLRSPTGDRGREGRRCSEKWVLAPLAVTFLRRLGSYQ